MIVVKDLLSSLVPKQASWKVQLLAQWHTIVGNLKTAVTLEKIYEDTLILGVDNSSWMQELYLLSPLLVSMINTRLDQPRIKTVRFKLIARQKRTPKNENYQKRYIQLAQQRISAKEEHALSGISDESLRASLRQFLMRCYQERT